MISFLSLKTEKQLIRNQTIALKTV